MDIMEYDNVDPLGVLHLNLVSLGYPLSLERVALIRQFDPRPFPFFALYAVEDGLVIGQVGIYRLPVVTVEGFDEVGGICAMCTHPAFARRGVASRLLEEAHRRMREAGLQFSTLGTARHRAAHTLYLKHGYKDAFTPTLTFASRKAVCCDTHLRAVCADIHGLMNADALFQRAFQNHLGFARRHKSFFPMMVATGEIGEKDMWLLQDQEEVVGYALAKRVDSVLQVVNLLLLKSSDAAAAVSALARNLQISYIQVRADQPSIEASLRQAGYPRAMPGWSTFMVKPLTPEAADINLSHHLGIATVRFLISSMDIT